MPTEESELLGNSEGLLRVYCDVLTETISKRVNAGFIELNKEDVKKIMVEYLDKNLAG